MSLLYFVIYDMDLFFSRCGVIGCVEPSAILFTSQQCEPRKWTSTLPQGNYSLSDSRSHLVHECGSRHRKLHFDRWTAVASADRSFTMTCKPGAEDPTRQGGASQNTFLQRLFMKTDVKHFSLRSCATT